MSPRAQIWLTVAGVALLGAAGVGTSAMVGYRAALTREREHLRDLVAVETQHLEAALSGRPGPDGLVTAEEASSAMAAVGHPESWTFGSTGEVVIAVREDAGGATLLSPARGTVDLSSAAILDSGIAQPTGRGLAGVAGSMTGTDYRGREVLAAHAPVGATGLAVVAKIDLAEVRAPYLRAAALAAAVGFLFVLLGSWGARRVGAGLIRRTEEREAELATVMDNLPESGVFVLDRDLRYLFAAGAVWRRLGLDVSSVPGKSLAEVAGAEAALELEPHYRRALEGETVRFDRERYDRFFQMVASPLRDRRGGVERILVLAMDITERRASEERAELLAAAVEQAANMVIITDADGTIEYVNPAFERVTGFARDEAVGANPRILKSGAHDPGFYASMWATLGSGRTFDAEFTNRRKDGTAYRHRATIFPMTGRSGRIERYVGIATDVTEEHRLREQLRQSQKMELVGQVVGGLSHDFKNVLATILANADTLHHDLDRGRAPTREQVVEIETAARAGTDLVARLMTLARRERLEPAPVPVTEVLDDVRALVRRVLPETIDVRIDAPPSRLWAALDRGAMIQIMLNLAVNARDAMPRGGAFTVLAEQQAGHARVGEGATVRFVVADTGTGMDATVLQRIFEPFFTTKEPGKGTGLGLPMVQALATLQGGWVEAVSRPGEGTTFTLTFPGAEAGPRADAPARAPETLARWAGSEAILVVEDEQSLRRALRRALSGLGYVVIEAGDGVEALGVIMDPSTSIDLVLTDAVMPKMGGIELVQRVREGDTALPFVLMSGYECGDLPGAGGLPPELPYLPKPWTVEEVARTVRQTLDTHGRNTG